MTSLKRCERASPPQQSLTIPLNYTIHAFLTFSPSSRLPSRSHFRLPPPPFPACPTLHGPLISRRCLVRLGRGVGNCRCCDRCAARRSRRLPGLHSRPIRPHCIANRWSSCTMRLRSSMYPSCIDSCFMSSNIHYPHKHQRPLFFVNFVDLSGGTSPSTFSFDMQPLLPSNGTSHPDLVPFGGKPQ